MWTAGKRRALGAALGAAAIAAIAVAACVQQAPFPGDELLGTFAFDATLLPTAPGETTCDYEELEVDGGVFGFDATLSRETSTGQVWMTVRNVVRDAGFDGQRFDSYASGPRRFVNCACEGAEAMLHENMVLLLLSSSQVDALGGGCTDGGELPADAGPPRSTSTGFDARRACGELSDDVVPTLKSGTVCLLPDGGPGCVPCTVRYRLDGVRK